MLVKNGHYIKKYVDSHGLTHLLASCDYARAKKKGGLAYTHDAEEHRGTNSNKQKGKPPIKFCKLAAAEDEAPCACWPLLRNPNQGFICGLCQLVPKAGYVTKQTRGPTVYVIMKQSGSYCLTVYRIVQRSAEKKKRKKNIIIKKRTNKGRGTRTAGQT